MTGTLSDLAVALAIFVAGHFVLSAGPARRRLVGAIGEGPFRGIYSALSLATFAWVVAAYVGAPDVTVWQPPFAFRHLAVSIMPFACVFIVAGYTSPNPSFAFGVFHSDATPGIIRITRHPVMWGVALWGIVHGLANGDAAMEMLAGAMAALALGGALHIEARRAGDAKWQALKAETSFVPFAAVFAGRVRVRPGDIGWARIWAGLALYAGLLLVHRHLFGVSPLPLPGG